MEEKVILPGIKLTCGTNSSSARRLCRERSYTANAWSGAAGCTSLTSLLSGQAQLGAALQR